MTRPQSRPSIDPMHVIDPAEHQRKVALAIRRAGIGLESGPPMWVILSANKDTDELMCGICSVLPSEFTPSDQS